MTRPIATEKAKVAVTTRGMTLHVGGKVILIGEHAVVYGAKALACPISQGITVQFVAGREHSWTVDSARVDIQARGPLEEALAIASRMAERVGVHGAWTVTSEIPPSMGLGWSAAVSWGVGCLIARMASGVYPKAIAEQMEEVFHGNASGLDLATVSSHGLTTFKKVDGHPEVTTREKLPSGTYLLAGTKPARTCDMVGGLAERYAADPQRYQPLIEALGAEAEKVEGHLLRDNLPRLGESYTTAHKLLRECGVSCDELDTLVDTALEHGAYGAKLTGKGGGGCMFALVPEEKAEAVGAALAPHASFVRPLTFGGAS